MERRLTESGQLAAQTSQDGDGRWVGWMVGCGVWGGAGVQWDTSSAMQMEVREIVVWAA